VRIIGIGLLILLILVIMPLPSWVARFRKHPNLREIYYLNVVLVWTGIGWVILLIWAVSGQESEKIRKLRERYRR
jgi:uncharacterized membrane protein